MKFITRRLKTIYWRIKSFGAMHYYGNPSKKLKIVGVTGTNGKTTTATLLYEIALGLGYKAGLIGTVENLINGEKIVLNNKNPMPGTTPDSVTLTKIFAQMAEKNCEYVFMEVSSHAVDQNRVLGISFAGGIFTNLTHDHLDYHKNFENYFLAKKKFFKMLPKNAFALSNTDDEHGRKMLEGIRAKKFLYGFQRLPEIPEVRPQGQEGLFYGEISKLDFSGLELVFNKTKIKSRLLGKFNAYNLLSVWSASLLLGFDMNKVGKILENIKPPRGRFEYFKSSSGVLAVVDYAHTPDALEKIFLAVKEVAGKDRKLISVFGCGGDRDPQKRSIMGKIGAINSDVAIFTSDNPRNEDPNKIIEQMKTDLSASDLKKIKTIASRRDAILEAVESAQSGDIVLVAGKGHEDYQEINGVKSHFDDMEELKKAFT